jgi:Electron transfer DM13
MHIISTSGMATLCLTLVLGACGGGDNPPAAVAGGQTNGAQTCTKSNAKVGKVAVLQTLGHGVSGSAKVLDDCTIEISNFNYDGGGLPDVFAYGAIGSRFASGFAIGPNLFGTRRTNETVTLTLKTGDLDNMDGISIWCVRAGVSFGQGQFQ